MPGLKALLVCTDGGYWCYKVIQMMLFSWICGCCVAIVWWHLHVWLGYDGILFYAHELVY